MSKEMTTHILYTQRFRDSGQEFAARGFDRWQLPVFEIQPDGTEKCTVLFFPACIRFMIYAEPIGEIQETPVNLPAIDPAGLQCHTLCETLIVIPCSGSKRKNSGSSERSGDCILDSLPAELADELCAQRARNASTAQLDESVLLPAVERYTGYLYQAAGATLDALVKSSAGVLIISGGYGVIRATESIGWYSQSFKPGMWPNGLIGRCVEAYAAAVSAKAVVGFFSASTGYAKAFRKTSWSESVAQVFQVSPQARARDGAQRKVPRAQGEALTEISRRQQLPSSWTSNDGLRMQVTWLR